MKQPKEVIAHWVKTILAEGQGVAVWERRFCETVRDVLEQGSEIDDKQCGMVERIYTEKTA
jgi:hypothetical protein